MASEHEYPKSYVCLSCLHEQAGMMNCEKCKSRKLEHVGFKRQQLGEHWRELLRADGGKFYNRTVELDGATVMFTASNIQNFGVTPFF